MARITVQITTPSNNRVTVSPGVSALSSVQLYLNELVDVDTSGGQDGYVLTQQADGSFGMDPIVTRLDGLSDTNIVSPGPGDALVYDDQSSKWVPGGVKSVNGQEGDVVITIPSPPPTPGVSGLADTDITNLQDDQIIRYDSASGKWINEDLEALPSGGTTGQALVKATHTDYDVQWADVAVDVQYHQRYATTAETLRAGATETLELYFFAQADGNGLAESAQSDTATTGYDIRRKLYYSEAAQADPDTGTWVQFADIADDTTYASAKATLLEYLKERTGGTVPISLKMTWEEVAEAPTFTGLLNETYGSGAAAAYSVRRLNGLYTGSAIQVERSSDNTTQDIGFTVDGDLDESALTTFCTGTVCKVRTWYDQSQTGGTGSGNDAVQTTHANQPTIYTGGAIVKENGKPTVEFDGTNDGLNIASNIRTTGGASTVISVHKQVSTAQYVTYLGLHKVTRFFHSTDPQYSPLSISTSDTANEFMRYNNYTTGSQDLFFLSFDGSTQISGVDEQVLYVDGAVESKNATSFSLGTIPTNDNSIGYRKDTNSQFANVQAQEIIIYTSDKSTDRTSIESNIGDYFTQNTPLLDTYTGAAAAYSLRKLRSAYSGSAIRVRRSNDNAETDIGFNVFGELDTVSLAAHCGSNDGFVKTWYDQSGNTNDATQTTAANQPKIYDSLTGVVTENGKPAVDFDGVDDKLTGPSGLDYSTMLAAAVYSNAATNDQMLGAQSSNTDGWRFQCRTDARLRVANTNVDITGVPNSTNQFLQVGTIVSGTATNYLNSSNSASASVTIGTTTAFNLNLAHQITGFAYANIKMQEVLVYVTDQSANRTNIESNINTFYSIY